MPNGTDGISSGDHHPLLEKILFPRYLNAVFVSKVFRGYLIAVGDEEIRTNDTLFLSASAKIADIIEVKEAELEKLYHSLWDRRKEELEIRNIAKQVKTAWMLFKLGSNDHVILEADGKYTNHHIFLDRKSRELYVNTRNLLRFEGNLQYPNSTNDRESESEISLNEWLMDLRRVKASKLMFSYLARTMMNWRDSKTRHYQGVLTALALRSQKSTIFLNTERHGLIIGNLLETLNRYQRC